MLSSSRSRARRLRRAGVPAMAVACLSILGPGAAPASAGPVVEEVRANNTIVEATFAQPATGGQDTTVSDHLVNLVRNAHPDAAIKVALHSLGGTKAAALKDALIAETPGKDGGGSVQVVYDGTKMGTVPTALEAGLNDPANGGRFVRCGHNASSSTDGACIGPHPTTSQHAKYVLINLVNKTTGSSGLGYQWNTVWVSSSNMTPESGWEAYNNAVTVYGDTDLYAGIEKIFDKALQNNWPSSDFFVNPQGYAHGSSSNVTAWASPEYTDPYTTSTDFVWQRLNDITPEGSGNCQLRVMMAQFMGDPRGIAIADKLVALRRGGCWMWVMVGYKDPDGSGPEPFQPAIGKEVKDRLCGQMAVAAEDAPNIHDKAFTFKGLYLGARRQIVLTGSQNMTNQGLRDNDELFIRVGHSTTIYNAFQSHFGSIYSDTKKIC